MRENELSGNVIFLLILNSMNHVFKSKVILSS